MTLERSTPDETHFLRYPSMLSSIGNHLLIALILVASAIYIQITVLMLTREAEGVWKQLAEAVMSQSQAWSPYILESGTWRFAAAIAVIAFLLPSAINATQARSPLSGVSLRRHYAMIARVVSSTSMVALVIAFFGADYVDETTAIKLFLLSAATLVVAMGTALISSHEGRDALATLTSAKAHNDAERERREIAIDKAPYAKGDVRKAIGRVFGTGAVELIAIPGFLFALFLVPAMLELRFLNEQQTALVITIWMCFSITSALSAAVRVSATHSPMFRWIVRILMPLLLSAMLALYATVAFFPSEHYNARTQWIIFFSVVAVFTIGVLAYSSCKFPLNRFFRRTFPGSVIVAMARTSQRRDQSLSQSIVDEHQRRREMRSQHGEEVFLLPGEA